MPIFMRNWHRRLSIYTGILMLIIAVSGVALQVEMMDWRAARC
jgi:hypothetical protein